MLRFSRLIGRLSDWALIGATFLVAYLMVTQALEVVLRYIGHPTTWVFDLNLSAILGVVFLGLAGAQRAGEHIAVEVLPNNIGRRAKLLLVTVNSGAALVLLGMVIWFGTGMALESLRQGRTTGSLFTMPTAVQEFLLPIGAILMAFQVIIQLIESFRPGEGPTDGDGPTESATPTMGAF